MPILGTFLTVMLCLVEYTLTAQLAQYVSQCHNKNFNLPKRRATKYAVGIVIDTSDEDVSNVVMSDDGSGAGLRLPSMLISK